MLRLVICLVKEKRTFHYLVHNKTKKAPGFSFLKLQATKKNPQNYKRICKVKKNVFI